MELSSPFFIFIKPLFKAETDCGISILVDSLCIDWRIPLEHANLSEKDTKHDEVF